MTMTKTPCDWPWETKPRSAISAPSLADSIARSVTATAPPRESSSSVGTPPCRRARGTADDPIVVLDPETGKECPRVERAPDGAILNAAEATGEIVNLNPGRGFEGYYRNRSEERRVGRVGIGGR